MSIERRFYILQLIPSAPESIDAPSIRRKLESGWGISASMRKIQRDLEFLSAIFPLRAGSETKPYQWSFMADSELVLMPKMNINTALTLRLAEEMLVGALPIEAHIALKSINSITKNLPPRRRGGLIEALVA